MIWGLGDRAVHGRTPTVGEMGGDGSSEVVRAAIEALPPAAAAALFLAARRGASYREVAEQLGWAPERVAREVRRSLLAVRARMSQT